MNTVLLWLSLIIGVMPFERLNLRGNKILSYLHMFVMPTIYLVCFGLVRLGPFGLKAVGECGKLCNLANIVFDYMGLCMYLFQHIFTLFRRKQFYIDFEKSLASIDACLRKCSRRTAKYVYMRKSKTQWYYITWALIIVCFAIVAVFQVQQLIKFHDIYFFIGLMGSSFPYLACSTVIGQFHYYIFEISERFCILNELFNVINNEIEDTYVSVMCFDIETEGKKDLLTDQEIRQRHRADRATITGESNELNNENDLNNTDSFAAGRRTSETNLPDLFKIHDKILALCALTNGQYGIQVAPYMTVGFVLSNLGIFMWIKIYNVVGGKNVVLDYLVLLYVYWSVATLFVAYLILRICYKSNGYSKQSAEIVHEIMQKKPPFMLGNDIYYNKMKSFTLQFLHWNEYFQFNAIGLYALDYTFIFTCISATTSYLVVLLQFDLLPFLQEDRLI